MIILSHRGYWQSPEEKNEPVAFGRSFGLGFGTETDLRDLGGDLVVAHDPPAPGALPAASLFEAHAATPGLPLALNIKADGLQEMLLPLLERFRPADAFVFDMAVPDALGWVRAGVPAFTRQSEIEREPAFYDRAAGVWLDGFEDAWWDEGVIDGHLAAGKRVCIVSPELHKRDHRPVWERIAGWEVARDPRVMICTDFPEEAQEVLPNGD